MHPFTALNYLRDAGGGILIGRLRHINGHSESTPRRSLLGRKGEFGVFVSSHTARFLVNGRSTAHSRPDLLRAPPAAVAEKRKFRSFICAPAQGRPESFDRRKFDQQPLAKPAA
jgi:hypothetical protein